MSASWPSPTDGRASIVRLTQQGRECFEGMAEAHHEWIEAMLAGPAATERRGALRLLGALKQSLAADHGEE
jgi:DNA-binding MarR family transcriptional regulator